MAIETSKGTAQNVTVIQSKVITAHNVTAIQT